MVYGRYIYTIPMVCQPTNITGGHHLVYMPGLCREFFQSMDPLFYDEPVHHQWISAQVNIQVVMVIVYCFNGETSGQEQCPTREKNKVGCVAVLHLLDKKDSFLIVASWVDFTRKQSCNMEPILTAMSKSELTF